MGITSEMADRYSKLSCYDVLENVEEVLGAEDYILCGGVFTEAIRDPASVIDEQSKTTIAQESSAQTVLRKDRTIRDADFFLNRILEKDEARAIAAKVAEATGNTLLISVFGLEPHLSPEPRLHRALRFAKAGLSKRTIDEHGILRYEMYPLEQEVEAESYNPWRLVMPSGKTVRTFHPAGHVIAYEIRSISGLRHKDSEKYPEMRAVVDDMFAEEIREGVFKAWQDFADLKNLVGLVGKTAAVQGNDSVLKLAHASDFSLEMLRRKGTLLRALESHPKLVKIAQEGVLQKILNVFVQAG